MNIHFIAIGGAAMHNLAIALKEGGHNVTGSDDEIFEPSRGRLDKMGLLPENEGWYPEKIHTGLDCVVLGMHAKKDNPELKRAGELGVKIFSYPEYLYEHAKNKTRVVIGGSHGKTTITAMVLHVLNLAGKEFDYMVGAQLKGFTTMVKMTDAPIMVLEGDEYLTSPIDPRPKFHLYKPNIALLTGVAWDHINVFPTFEMYVDQFRQFINLIEPNGTLVYFNGDQHLDQLAEEARADIKTVAYDALPYEVKNGVTYVQGNSDAFDVALSVIGRHNLQNIAGAMQVCIELGVSKTDFFNYIQTFEGAAKRLELLKNEGTYSVYRDFAHAPSKLKATVDSVKEHFSDRKVIACFELHTFSSLNKEFLQQYQGCMDAADEAIVYFSNHAIELKRLENLSMEEVREAFARPGLEVYNNAEELFNRIKLIDKNNAVLLLMSSGNFDGLDLLAV